MFGTLHDLILSTLPPMPIRIGLHHVLILVGAAGLIRYEIRLWRRP